MKKKLLLISLSVGSGHVRAAEAIKKTAEQSFPHIEVEHIDMADFIRLPMKMAVLKSYDVLVKQLPELWGFLYKKTDNPGLTRRFQKVSRLLNQMNTSALVEYIKNAAPDFIVCTHFMPAQTIIDAGKKLDIRPSVVMTDYAKHTFLTYDGVRDYFVATERMKFTLERSGIPKETIHVTGIPVDPVFTQKKDTSALRRSYGFSAKEPMLLVLSGGQGLIKIHDIVSALFALRSPVRIVAVAGSNVNLQKKLKALTPPSHVTLSVVGWTDAIDEYMRMATVVVTKPGGMTTTECIALGKRIIAIEPIPGQEEHNAEYILEHGYGSIAHNTNDLLFFVTEALKENTPLKKAPTNVGAKRILEIISNN